MPWLTHISTAVPPHGIDQAVARHAVSEQFDGHVRNLNRYLSIFDNAGVERRYFTTPLEWFRSQHTQEEVHELYVKWATELSVQVTRDVLSRARLTAADVDYIIYVNTTGLATPSIDARLINRMGLRADVRRTPVWGLGCAGGAAGLAHAHHHLLGHPRDCVLVIAAEFCGLTFIPDDYSVSNIVATSLFGDGVAGALVVGDERAASGLQTIHTRSTFFPDSLGIMGWNFTSRGMQVVFDRRIPRIISEHAADDLAGLLKDCGLEQDDVGAYLFHPGGPKVMDAYSKALNVESSSFRLSREVLARYGNMSSATVLFVVKEYLDAKTGRQGDHVLMSSLGPGFSAEWVVARFQP